LRDAFFVVVWNDDDDVETAATHEEVINLARYPKLSFSLSLFVNGDLLNGWGKCWVSLRMLLMNLKECC